MITRRYPHLWIPSYPNRMYPLPKAVHTAWCLLKKSRSAPANAAMFWPILVDFWRTFGQIRIYPGFLGRTWVYQKIRAISRPEISCMIYGWSMHFGWFCGRNPAPVDGLSQYYPLFITRVLVGRWFVPLLLLSIIIHYYPLLSITIHSDPLLSHYF